MATMPVRSATDARRLKTERSAFLCLRLRLQPFFFILLAFAAPAMAQPVINAGGVVNASGYQTTLAPDTVFAVFGKGLGPNSLIAAPAPDYPASLGGTSIAFTPLAGGTAIPASVVYASFGQAAGLLPSSIAPGTYAVRVTYNSQVSDPQTVTVLARNFGIATMNSAGTGPAQATIANVNGGISLVRFTNDTLALQGLNWTLVPAHPGDTIVLWGTGGGADPKNDAGGTSGDQTAAGSFSVNVAGTQITPLYAGASPGYPGLWQINLTLPAGIPADCFASVQVSAAGALSNAVTMAIAPAGQDACSSPGFSIPALSKLGSGKNVTSALLSLAITGNADTKSVSEAVSVQFAVYSASAFLTPFAGLAVGPCHIFQESYIRGQQAPSAMNFSLDAGTVTISGPGISGTQTLQVLSRPVPGPGGKYYYGTFPAGTIVRGGTYTIAGTGGADVAAFSVTQTMPAAFDVTDLAALTTIDRSQPTTVAWTGGGSGSVLINLETLIYDSTLTRINDTFVACTAQANAGSFTIPPAAMAYLAAVGTDTSDLGAITISVNPSFTADVTGVSSAAQEFLPNLTAGGATDFGAFSGQIAIGQRIAIR